MIKIVLYLIAIAATTLLVFKKELQLNFDQLFQYVTLIIAIVSAVAVLWTADSTKRIAEDTQKARRPYLKLVRVPNPSNYLNNSNNTIVFPYVLENTGDSAAIKIHKDHIVIKLDRKANEEKISDYKENNNLSFALIPNDQSITHPDNIFLGDVNTDVGSFFVEFTIWYQSDIPHDNRQFKSYTKFQLVVEKVENNHYIFSTQNVILEKNEETFEKPIR